MDVQKRFGTQLQSLRKEHGISQEKFALSIEMDRTYYASVEAGRRNISLQNINQRQDSRKKTIILIAPPNNIHTEIPHNLQIICLAASSSLLKA